MCIDYVPKKEPLSEVAFTSSIYLFCHARAAKSVNTLRIAFVIFPTVPLTDAARKLTFHFAQNVEN